MEQEAPSRHDPSARLGSLDAVGPDGLERLVEPERLDKTEEVVAIDATPRRARRPRRAGDAGTPASDVEAAARRRRRTTPAFLAVGLLVVVLIGAAAALAGDPGDDAGTSTGGTADDAGAPTRDGEGPDTTGPSPGSAGAAGTALPTTVATVPAPPATAATPLPPAGGATTTATAVPTTAAHPPPAMRPPMTGECAVPDPANTARLLQVACESPQATVRLLAALPSPPPLGTSCPVGTDHTVVVGQELWCLQTLPPPAP